MRRIILLTVWLSLAIVQSMAQNVEVASFELLELDLTANTHGTIKYDQNGEKASLIKIQTPERGFTFDGGAMGIVAMEEHVGEIWLYVPRQSRKLTIKHKDYGVKRDYYYPIPVEGGRTYEMYIDIGMGRYVTITSQWANSTIFIDGVEVGKSPLKNLYLNYGKHTIMAQKDRYEGEQSFMITTNDEQRIRLINVEQRDMSDRYGDVFVNVDNNADIYYDGKKVGTGTWKTQLREGSYMVEARKADCDPAKTSFTVVAQKRNDINATAPIPHTGWLHVYTRPRNVKTTPFDTNEMLSLPIGTYQLEFTKKGYVAQNMEYTVRRNEITRDTVTLQRITYVKPNGFYVGGGFTLSNLYGFTGVLGVVFKQHDIQASYTFGVSETSTVYTAGSGQQTGMKFKQNSIAIKYGYQIPVLARVALIPQVGYSYNFLNGTLVEGSTKFGDNANASCVTVGLKALAAPMQHLYVFVAPEYDIAINKSKSYEAIAEEADFNAGGFAVHAGILINF